MHGARREASEVVTAIATTHALRTEAAWKLPSLEAAAKQIAGPDGVMRVIGARFATLGKPDLSEGEWGAWWADQIAILGDLPEFALEAGMVAYLALPDSEFLPKPGRLRQLALDTPNPMVRAYTLCKQALAYQAPSYVPYAEKVRAPELQTMPAGERRRMGDEALEALKAHRAPERERRAYKGTPGKVDASGLTAEMVRVMGFEPLPDAQAAGGVL